MYVCEKFLPSLLSILPKKFLEKYFVFSIKQYKKFIASFFRKNLCIVNQTEKYMAPKSNYQRILLKLSGETLMGHQSFGIDQEASIKIADAIAHFHQAKIQVGVVIGGGNIFRGVDLRSMGIPRTPADHMGMLATILNGIALQQALILRNIPTCLMSALECPKVAEPYNWTKALQHLESGNTVIFVGGTGNPYFTNRHSSSSTCD